MLNAASLHIALRHNQSYTQPNSDNTKKAGISKIAMSSAIIVIANFRRSGLDARDRRPRSPTDIISRFRQCNSSCSFLLDEPIDANGILVLVMYAVITNFMDFIRVWLGRSAPNNLSSSVCFDAAYARVNMENLPDRACAPVNVCSGRAVLEAVSTSEKAAEKT